MVLAQLVHDLVKLAMTVVALFGFVAIMFLSVVHELAPTLVVFLCG
jgi:hypothetical protein